MSEQRERCGTCRFSDIRLGGDVEQRTDGAVLLCGKVTTAEEAEQAVCEPLGLCRRAAPIGHVVPNVHGLPGVAGEAIWPVVWLRWDWCGEWQAKHEETASGLPQPPPA